MTLRPLGPSVTLTALARTSMPDSILSRASVEKRKCLAAMMKTSNIWMKLFGLTVRRRLSRQHAHNVGFFHDQKVSAVDLDLGPRPFAKENLIAHFHVHRRQFTRLVASPRTDGDNLALLGLLLGGIGNDDTALRL